MWSTGRLGGSAGDPLPHALQVRGAERAIVQPVTGTPALAPDHAPVIGPHRAVETCLVQSGEHGAEIHVAEARRIARRTPALSAAGMTRSRKYARCSHNCSASTVPYASSIARSVGASYAVAHPGRSPVPRDRSMRANASSS